MKPWCAPHTTDFDKLIKMRQLLLFIILNVTSMVLFAGTPANNTNRYVMRAIRSAVRDEKWSEVISQASNCITTSTDEFDLIEVYQMRMQAYEKLLKQHERKMYLNQSNDTATYFNYIYNIVYDSHSIDSLCTNVIGKRSGAVASAKKQAANISDKYSLHVKEGGLFHYNKFKYADAIKFLEFYVSHLCSSQSELTQLSRLAFLSAYTIGDNHRASHFASDALKPLSQGMSESRSREDENLKHIYELCARNYEVIEDIKSYKQTLTAGMKLYPKHEYFYLSLIKLLNLQGNYQKALDVASTVIGVTSTNRNIWFIKGSEEVRLGRTKDALESFKAATEVQADDADSYAAIGNIYLNMARDYRDKTDAASSISLAGTDTYQKQSRRRLYLQAKDSFERARHFAADRSDLWIQGLREVYYRLNMGKELQQLDKL